MKTNKKNYVRPELKTYKVLHNNVIATSTRAQNEQYESGNISGWYN